MIVPVGLDAGGAGAAGDVGGAGAQDGGFCALGTAGTEFCHRTTGGSPNDAVGLGSDQRLMV